MDSIVVVGLPIVSFVILKKNFSILDKEEQQIKYGSLYLNLNQKKSSVKSFLTLQSFYRIKIALASVYL